MTTTKTKKMIALDDALKITRSTRKMFEQSAGRHVRRHEWLKFAEAVSCASAIEIVHRRLQELNTEDAE